MIASNVTLQELEAAAAQVGVSIDARALSESGRRWRVKVNPISEVYLGPRGGEHRRRKYQRISASMYGNGRKIHAVCWHGFRDFFRAVYAVNPGAKFKTAFATWNGSADFEARFRNSGHRNIGAPIAPVAAAEACACPESGYAN